MAGEPTVLVEVWTSYQSGWTRAPLTPGSGDQDLLRATAERLFVDRKGRKGQWDRILDVGVSEIRAVDIDEVSRAWQEGRSFARGILRSGKKYPAVTGIVVVLTTGEHVLFHAAGRAPIDLRAAFGPLLRLLQSH